MARAHHRWRKLQALADLDRLVALEREIYPEEDCITAAEYLDYVEAGHEVWLLEIGGEWVGNYQVCAMPDDAPGGLGGTYVAGLAVFKRFQHQGFGHVAMAHLLAGRAELELAARARADNVASQHLLTGYGFSYVGDQVREGALWRWYARAPGAAAV